MVIETTRVMDSMALAAAAGAKAEAIYRRSIRSKIAEDDLQKYLYIDIDSGDYEVDANEDFAEDKLRERRPDGFFVVMRADGGPAAHFGSTTG